MGLLESAFLRVVILAKVRLPTFESSQTLRKRITLGGGGGVVVVSPNPQILVCHCHFNFKINIY